MDFSIRFDEIAGLVLARAITQPRQAEAEIALIHAHGVGRNLAVVIDQGVQENKFQA